MHMARILIVDDEQMIREVVREYALINGYEVAEASDGLEALELVEKEDFDCVILDIMMPKLDGFSACKQIKKIKPIPIIMLSARQARVKVILERFKTKDTEVLRFEGLQINIEGRSVTVDGEKANLTPKEIDLLLYMVKNKNIALSRMKLLEEVWDYDYFGDDRTVDTHIKMLRHNLKDYRKFIVTVRGMGYKFEA